MAHVLFEREDFGLTSTPSTPGNGETLDYKAHTEGNAGLQIAPIFVQVRSLGSFAEGFDVTQSRQAKEGSG